MTWMACKNMTKRILRIQITYFWIKQFRRTSYGLVSLTWEIAWLVLVSYVYCRPLSSLLLSMFSSVVSMWSSNRVFAKVLKFYQRRYFQYFSQYCDSFQGVNFILYYLKNAKNLWRHNYAKKLWAFVGLFFICSFVRSSPNYLRVCDFLKYWSFFLKTLDILIWKPIHHFMPNEGVSNLLECTLHKTLFW